MPTKLAYAPRVADEDLSEALSLRVTPDDRAALDVLAARFPMKAMTIARIALRLGLAELARNPAALLGGAGAEPPKTSPSKPKGRAR